MVYILREASICIFSPQTPLSSIVLLLLLLSPFHRQHIGIQRGQWLIRRHINNMTAAGTCWAFRPESHVLPLSCAASQLSTAGGHRRRKGGGKQFPCTYAAMLSLPVYEVDILKIRERTVVSRAENPVLPRETGQRTPARRSVEELS